MGPITCSKSLPHSTRNIPTTQLLTSLPLRLYSPPTPHEGSSILTGVLVVHNGLILCSSPSLTHDLPRNPVASTPRTCRFPPLILPSSASACILSMAAPWYLLPPSALVYSQTAPIGFLSPSAQSHPITPKVLIRAYTALNSTGPSPL